MNILAICHDCRLRHMYRSANGHDLFDRLGEWRDKHPPGRCQVDFLPDLGGHPIIDRVAGYGQNADVKLAYASSVALTITLASLATSSTKLAGRASTAVVNTSNLYLDYLVGGKITSGTSPTDARTIEVLAYGAVNDTPTYPDSITGTDANKTMTSANIKNAALRLLLFTATNNTSDRTYWFAPSSLAVAFNGILPTHFGVFGTHNTGVNLNSTASNHALHYTPVYQTVI